MARDKDDRGMRSASEPLLQLQSTDIRKLDVKNQAARHVRFGAREVFGRGTEGYAMQPGRIQQVRERFAYAGIVVNDKNQMIGRYHWCSLKRTRGINMSRRHAGIKFYAHVCQSPNPGWTR